MRLIICGMGVVGQSFVKLLIDSSESLYKKYGIKPRIVACADSNGVAYSQTGLDLEKLLLVKKKYGTVAKYSIWKSGIVFYFTCSHQLAARQATCNY